MKVQENLKLQDYITNQTREAANEFFKYAKAVPKDKIEWSPCEGGRNTLSLCQELAMTPTWAYDTIEAGKIEWNEEAMAEQSKLMKQFTTIDECEKQFNERFKKLEDLYRGISDERLSEKKWLPYDGGREFTVLEMMDYPRWNATYHTGQIAYIQTCYGDKDMH